MPGYLLQIGRLSELKNNSGQFDFKTSINPKNGWISLVTLRELTHFLYGLICCFKTVNTLWHYLHRNFSIHRMQPRNSQHLK